MIKVDNIKVFNFEGAIRGMRNPLNSWEKSDTVYIGVDCDECPYQDECERLEICGDDCVLLGANDLDLMKRLYKGGSEHRKYLRQIFVSMDVLAPLYWWKEADQYRINVTTNSCSTMHKIHAKEFTLDDFSCEHLDNTKKLQLGHNGNFGYDVYITSKSLLEITIGVLNYYREKFIETKNKEYWWQMIQLLPSSYNQKRTVTMNYENVMTMINQRSNHKLDEWRAFVEVLKGLPYVMDIRGEK